MLLTVYATSRLRQTYDQCCLPTILPRIMLLSLACKHNNNWCLSSQLRHPTMSENAAAEPMPIQDKTDETEAKAEPVVMKKPAQKSKRKQQQRKQQQRSQQRQRQMLPSESAKQRRTRNTTKTKQKNKKEEGEEPKKTESFAEKANKRKQQDKQANDEEDSNEAQDKEEGSVQNSSQICYIDLKQACYLAKCYAI